MFPNVLRTQPVPAFTNVDRQELSPRFRSLHDISELIRLSSSDKPRSLWGLSVGAKLNSANFPNHGAGASVFWQWDRFVYKGPADSPAYRFTDAYSPIVSLSCHLAVHSIACLPPFRAYGPNHRKRKRIFPICVRPKSSVTIGVQVTAANLVGPARNTAKPRR
jgi:hypothetical protein